MAHTPRSDDPRPGGGRSPAVARDDWDEEEHTRVDYAECTDANCMNVNVNVGYQGLTDVDYTWSPAYERPGRGNQSVGDDVRSAWKTQLEREGKHDTGGSSLRDFIFGSSRPQ